MIRVPYLNPARTAANAAEPEYVLRHPAWMRDAVCASIGGRQWDALEVAAQIDVCQSCDVAGICGEYGIEQLENTSGGKTNTTVYGGLTPDQIVAEHRRRRAERESNG